MLEDYVGTSIVDFAVELENDDCSDMDLTVYSNFHWEIFAKRGGTLIQSWDLNSGVTVLSNVITLNRSRLYGSEIRKGLTYYHHVIGVRKLEGNELTQEDEVLLYGTYEAI